MKPGSLAKLSCIAGAATLVAVLYFMPREGDHQSKPETTEEHHDHAFSIDSYVAQAIERRVKGEDKTYIAGLQQVVETASGEERKKALDSLSAWFDRQKDPATAAFFCEKVAIAENSEKSWLNAAFRYFDGFKQSVDSITKSGLVQKAIECYTKVTDINPDNLDAKTDLGVCYTETTQPMKGITLLREVVEKKPDHEMAQMNLGVLSVRSRQYDKAIDRFRKVLSINPKRSDVLLYLGEAYAETGNREEAIASLEQFLQKSNDEAAKMQVIQYIKQLKTVE